MSSTAAECSLATFVLQLVSSTMAESKAHGGDEDVARMGVDGSHHEFLMHRAIDVVCERPSRNPEAAPRAGEMVALEAYVRIVRRALADGESGTQLAEWLKVAGVAPQQAAAAAAVFAARLPEMRTHMVGAMSQVCSVSAVACSLSAWPVFAARCAHVIHTAWF